MHTLSQICEITRGQLIQGDPDFPIQKFVFDTRRISRADGFMFLALKGKKRNGHDFISSAYAKGIRCFLVSEKVEKLKNAHVILVEDVLSSIQKIAKAHRRQFSYPVIAITGSNGKTMVKEGLYQILKSHFKIIRSPRSYNSQLGVALSLLNMDTSFNLAIIEAGISKPGEMNALMEMIVPDICLFTHIGPAHDEGFSGRDEKIKEKITLAKNSSKIILHANEIRLKELLEAAYPRKELILVDKNLSKSFTHDSEVFPIPQNLDLCIETCMQLGLTREKIQQAILSSEGVSMRLEVEKGQRDCILINDSYSADLHSLETALQFLESQCGHRKKTLVLGPFEESGVSQKAMAKMIDTLCQQYGHEELLWIDPVPRDLDKLETTFRCFSSIQEVLTYFQMNPPHSECILIKGPRKLGLEKLFHQLTSAAHNTVLEIDLDAMGDNLAYFSNLLESKTKIMAVIKAGAYGSGAIEVGEFLMERGVDYLAVAKVNEGVALRKAGITAPIVILNPDDFSIHQLMEYHLEPEVYSIKQLLRLVEHGSELDIHLNIDTGMNRLGFKTEEMDELLNVLKDYTIQVKSIFSHLSCSEDKDQNAFTLNQIDRFNKCYKYITDALDYLPLKHILNSSGILNFPDAQFDMVRIGLGLYGIDSTNNHTGLKKVHQLRSKIIQIKTVKTGESVGYGRDEILNSDKTIATIPIGYADGLLRNSGCANYACLVLGQDAPIIGRVSMDLTTIDVSHISEAKIDTEVIIFGQEKPIEILAKANDTIPYEILSRISPRVKRLFIKT